MAEPPETLSISTVTVSSPSKVLSLEGVSDVVPVVSPALTVISDKLA